MARLGTRLMHHMDDLLQLIQFNSSIELDYLQIVRCLEGMRQRCCRLGHDLTGAREQLRKSEFERSVLEVKLKHARNQVEVEMKKRHQAEAELEKQDRKLKLIYDYLMADPHLSPLTEDQCSALAALDGRCFGRSTLLPGKRLSVVEELGTSFISDISFDPSDDDVRTSLTPLIQPVVAAKRVRPSVAPTPRPCQSSEMSLAPRSAESKGAIHSLPPLTVVPRRRSQQSNCISTFTDVTTIWGSSGESGGRSSRCESDPIGTEVGEELRDVQDPFSSPSPHQRMPPLQSHHFTSKTVIRLESCAVCRSRLRFGKVALKCRPCQLLIHPECKDRCSSLCIPGAHPRVRDGTLADFAPSTPPLVPHIVVQCVNQVEKRGLQETGLYRVPGAEHLVREWKHKLLHAQGAIPSLDDVTDVNVICGILKDFLRGLKEPLVTFCLHSAFLHAADIPDESARHTALCHVLMKLPLANRHTLAFLMLHLHRVMASPECRMDRHNLSRVFGPTLVGHSTPKPTPFTIMEDTPRQCQVVASLLTLPLGFWKRFVGEEQENLVPSVQPHHALNEQERLFRPLTSPKINTIQMSPGSGGLPSKQHACTSTTYPSLNVTHTKKTGRLFPFPT
ncbi:rac GTPase-activating protein 1-like isoform X2 [Hemicordylus capensis]|uniref:rac GTPase-activating protein 1-like isoform X2 n=1 Tax=Hemicordylus capensis TaxID=884348 RepID=UPI002303E7FA|nr:rac GTPase-activating protein 1-like isoform X2 [Hemicordylus capensis]